MSIMVCKKCGHQVDTDFHAEQMNDDGLCDACAPEEYDTVKNSEEYKQWFSKSCDNGGVGAIIERAFVMERALTCIRDYDAIGANDWKAKYPKEDALLDDLAKTFETIGIVMGFMKIAADALEGTENAGK